MTGHVIFDLSTNNVQHFEIGIPTGLSSKDSLELFTGDEVSYKGRMGFIGKIDNEYWYITNKERSRIKLNAEKELKEWDSVFICYDLPFMDSGWLTIAKSHLMHKDGDIIALGRKGHSGFQISMKE